jgi:3',5'-cyclic AMP phosphodiesterase CpdA
VVTVDLLEPDTEHPVLLDGRRVATVRTAARPGGRLLGRVATLSDLHLGAAGTGALPRTSRRQSPRFEAPVITARAAAAEIARAGVDLVVVKGDLTQRDYPADHELAADVLGELAPRVVCMVGNHDGGNHDRVDRRSLLRDRGLAVQGRPVEQHRAREALVTLVDTVRPGRHDGSVLGTVDDVAALVERATGPALLFLHHQLMPWRIPHHLPTGVPAREARLLLDALTRHGAGTRFPALVSSGHTHRNRVRSTRGVVITEVGATRDYPGVYALYDVFDDAVVQSVRRIEHPAAVRLVERSARSAASAWAWWSPPRSPADVVARAAAVTPGRPRTRR